MTMYPMAVPKKKKEDGKNPYRYSFMPYAGGGSGVAASGAASSTPTVREVAASGNLLTTDEYLLIDATANRAFTLDTPSTNKKYYIKIIAGDGNVTLTPASGLIDDQATYIFSGEQSSIGVLFDGTDWWVLLS